MKKNILYVVMLVILAIVTITNAIDVVNMIKFGTPVNWAAYTSNYVALTLYFSAGSKKKKENK